MARIGRIKKEGDGHYHVMSRTNAKAFLFRSGRLKTEMVDLLRRSAAFSGITLDAFAILDNHFHAAVTVVKPDAPIGEAEIVKRIAILKGNKIADAVAEHLARLHKEGLSLEAENILDGWRRRMHDVSEFTKTFKELVSIRYKRENEYCGSIWSGRFASTVVEGGRYWAIVRRYIELNAVRAGIVGQLKDYFWCSHATTTDEPASPFVVISCAVLRRGAAPAKENVAGPRSQGTDPGWTGKDPRWEECLLGRVVQIGAGKIFGSFSFVEATIGANSRALPRGARVRRIFADAFASHGWRLAKGAARAA